MPILPYASIADLREAVHRKILIRFAYCGLTYTVEPHEILTNPRSGAFELAAWVIEFPDGSDSTWRRFRYSFIRGMDVLPLKFESRFWARIPPMVETKGKRVRG